jgi:hypothetical protein
MPATVADERPFGRGLAMSEQKEQNPIVKAFKVGTLGIWGLAIAAGILLALNTRTSTIKKTSSTKPSVQPSTSVPTLMASPSPVVVASPSAVVQPQSTPEVVVVTPTTSAVVQSQPTSSAVAKTPSLKAETPSVKAEPVQEKIEISNSSIDTAAYCAANPGLSSCPEGDNKILKELLKKQSQCVDKAEREATEKKGSLSDFESLRIFNDCRSSSGMLRYNSTKERYSNRSKTQNR